MSKVNNINALSFATTIKILKIDNLSIKRDDVIDSIEWETINDEIDFWKEIICAVKKNGVFRFGDWLGLSKEEKKDMFSVGMELKLNKLVVEIQQQLRYRYI